MPYRAIFSDIDGTLLNREHRMSARTLAAARHVVSLGIPFILVSARPPLAITPFTNAIGGAQPLIAYNGALILDGDLQELYSVPLDDADFRQLEAELETLPRLSLNYYQGTHWYSPEPDNYWTAQEGDITGLRASAKPAAPLTAVHKILVMGDAADILALENRLKPAYPHRRQCRRSHRLRRQLQRPRHAALCRLQRGDGQRPRRYQGTSTPRHRQQRRRRPGPSTGRTFPLKEFEAYRTRLRLR